MSARVIFRVVPDSSSRLWGWAVKRGRSLIGYWPAKREAVKDGREKARSARPSQLVIYKANGQIQEERTYGADPQRRKG